MNFYEFSSYLYFVLFIVVFVIMMRVITKRNKIIAKQEERSVEALGLLKNILAEIKKLNDGKS